MLPGCLRYVAGKHALWGTKNSQMLPWWPGGRCRGSLRASLGDFNVPAGSGIGLRRTKQGGWASSEGC